MLRPWLLYGLNFFFEFRIKLYKNRSRKKQFLPLDKKAKIKPKVQTFFQPKITKDKINKSKSSYLTGDKTRQILRRYHTLVSISQESTYDKLRREWVLTKAFKNDPIINTVHLHLCEGREQQANTKV